MANLFSEKDYTSVNFSYLSDLIGEWNATCQSFKGAIAKAGNDSTFQALENLGLSGGFPAKYDESLESLADDVLQGIKQIELYYSDLLNTDINVDEKFPDPPEEEEEEEEKKKKPKSNGKRYIDNTDDQLDFLSNISLSDLSEIVAILKSLAEQSGVGVDDLLNDESLTGKLKEKLLESPNLPEEYKVMIKEGYTKCTIEPLRSLVNGNMKQAVGLDDATILTLKTHLSNIATENNIEYDDIVSASTSQYSKILKSNLSSMNSIADNLSNIAKENVQKDLSLIYKGEYSDKDKLSDLTQSFVMTGVNSLSSLSEISLEELLERKEYGDAIYDGIENLKRVSIYSSLLSDCSNSSNILASIIK